MARNSGWDREEYEALRAMAQGVRTALDGFLSLDNIVHRRHAEAISKKRVLRKRLAAENWKAKWDVSLKTMLKLVDHFQTMNRYPQFSPLKKEIGDLLSKD